LDIIDEWGYHGDSVEERMMICLVVSNTDVPIDETWQLGMGFFAISEWQNMVGTWQLGILSAGCSPISLLCES
jgi:hypothetical protein